MTVFKNTIKEIKSKKQFLYSSVVKQVLEFCYFSIFSAVKSTCVKELVEGIMNGD